MALVVRACGLAVAAAAVAFVCAIRAGAQGGLPPPQVTGESADVPMLSHGLQPSVEVTINGKGSFVFAIDTGAAGDARADASLVKGLGLETIGEARGSAGGGTVQIMPIVRLDTVGLGGMVWHNVSAPSRDYNTSTRLPHIDGILCYHAFSEFLLTLDFPHKRMRLARGELPPVDGRTIHRLDLSRRIPAIAIDVAGRSLSADIDTGNVVDDLLLPASLAGDLPLKDHPVASGTVRTVSGSSTASTAELSGDVTVGSYVLRHPRVTFTEGPPDVNIGSGFLQRFVVTFDQKNGRVRLEPAASGASHEGGVGRLDHSWQ